MYVYIRSESNLWTVGHYAPAGGFVPESDHTTRADAAKRVHYLNGGTLHSPPHRIELRPSPNDPTTDPDFGRDGP